MARRMGLSVCIAFAVSAVYVGESYGQTGGQKHNAKALPPQKPSSGEHAAFEKFERIAKRQIPRARSRQEYIRALAKRFGEIVAAANEFLAAYPNSQYGPEVTYRKAYALCVLGNIENDAAKRAEGSKLLRALLTLTKSKNITSRTHLVLSYLTRGSNPAQAIQHAKQASENATDKDVGAEATYMLASLCESNNQEDEAKAAYQKLIRDYPHSRFARMAPEALTRLTLKGKELTDLKFKALDGSDVDIMNYRGKVVLIDFWATWCGPCRGEMPNVVRAYKKHKTAGFEIIGISLDRDKSALEQFVKTNGMSWPQYFDGQGWNNAIARKYGIRSIPSTFVLDRKGVVRAVNLRSPRLEKMIEALLTEK